MKYLKYYIVNRANVSTEENPEYEDILLEKSMPYSEANEEIAKREAWGGEYTVEDDGFGEPEAKPSPEERISDLESALELLLSGVTE